MDVLLITAFSSGIVAIVVAILTHLKHSECCKGMLECDTRSQRSVPSTPISYDPPKFVSSHSESDI